MKKHMKVLALILAVLLLSMLTACGKQPQPSDVLPKLENAYNKQDINAMLNCFEPSVKQAVSGIMGLFGDFAGFSGSALMDILPLASQLMGRDMDDSGMGKVKMTEISTSINGNDATMRVGIRYTFADGSTVYEEDTMLLVKVDGQWYLSALN